MSPPRAGCCTALCAMKGLLVIEWTIEYCTIRTSLSAHLATLEWVEIVAPTRGLRVVIVIAHPLIASIHLGWSVSPSHVVFIRRIAIWQSTSSIARRIVKASGRWSMRRRVVPRSPLRWVPLLARGSPRLDPFGMADEPLTSGVTWSPL